MSLIARTGLHRLPSRQQLAAELKACHRQKDAATVAAIKYATDAEERQQELDAAGITISGLLLDVEEAQREIASLRAALANATSVSDRPARAAVTETQPIQIVTTTDKVWPLGEARQRGYLQ